MTEKISLSAMIKEQHGKGAARALRRNNRIPAIIYGGDNLFAISVDAKEFLKEYHKGNIQSKLMEIALEGQKVTALTRIVQLHPVTDIPEHMDFQEVKEGAEVKVAVRLKILNEAKCPGIKKGGMLNVVARSISCYCDPFYIPNYIEVDLEGLEIGRSLHINDLELPKGVRPINSENFAIASISGREEEAAPEADKVA